MCVRGNILGWEREVNAALDDFVNSKREYFL
jgi:hypothetical protein